MQPTRTVAVLDVELEGQRRLVETVVGSGLEPHAASTLDELVRLLSDGIASVGLIAFEALWPEPQTKLRSLRDAAPNARLLVAYSDVPRERLGHRLWSIGLIDYFLPRSSPPHELASVLRQAIADALMEDLEGQRLDPQAAGGLLLGVRFLTEVGSAFANQSSVEGILRELHIKLPRLIEYSVLQVVTIYPDAPRGRLHVFQARPVPQELLWQLTEHICASASPYLDEPLTPRTLFYADNPPLATVDGDTERGEVDGSAVDNTEPVTLRLIHCGELVGCVVIMPSTPLTNEQRLCLRILAAQLATAIRSAQSLHIAETASLVDELTSAHNRRYLARVLPAEWRRARRYKLHLAVAMLDIDMFKRLNDEWGHLVGDDALRLLVSTIRENLRDTDHIVRYGGEEFLLILPETDAAEAVLVIERLRLLVHKQPVPTRQGEKVVQITFSAGIAAIPGCTADTAEQLVELADRALLIAKRTGRNRLCVAHDDDGETKIVTADLATDKRRFPRVPAELQVQYVPLPDFSVRAIALRATNFSAGGVGVAGESAPLKHNSYALVHFEHGDGPVLSQVVWTREGDTGQTTAGLRFLRGKDLEEVIEDWPRPSRPRALVMLSSRRTKSLVRRVLKAANYEGTFIESPTALDSTALATYSVILIGEGSARAEIVRCLRRAPSDQLPRIVLINEHGNRKEALETVRSSRVEHLVGDIDSEQALFSTLSKLLVGDYFGLTKYLLWGAEPKSWSIVSSSEKPDVLAGIRALAEAVDCHPRVCDLLIAAVDEMIINALTHSETNNPVPVFIEAASDSRLLGVAVFDAYGRLSPDNVFSSLDRALSYQVAGLPSEPERMSLGFWIMLNTLSHLAINIDPGHRTEIIGIVDLEKSLREIRQAVPSLGMFSKK